jgi:Zn-dependent protease
MSAAGPAGNLALAVIAFAIIKAGLAAGWFVPPDSVNFEHLVASADGTRSFAGALLSIFLMLNVLLCVFNLLPLPPLDGSAILEIFLPQQMAQQLGEWSRQPMFQMIGLLVAWRVFPAIASPLFSFVLKLVHPGASYS